MSSPRRELGFAVPCGSASLLPQGGLIGFLLFCFVLYFELIKGLPSTLTAILWSHNSQSPIFYQPSQLCGESETI